MISCSWLISANEFKKKTKKLGDPKKCGSGTFYIQLWEGTLTILHLCIRKSVKQLSYIIIIINITS